MTAGLFTVQLDFGACATCFDGTARFLEITVKPTSGSTYRVPLFKKAEISGTQSERMTITESGNVGIGATAPDQLLSVNGNASKVGGGSWLAFSDERLKNIHGAYKTGLSALVLLQPIRFEYKPDNALGLNGLGEYVGFSAQEVERILPEAVTRSASGYLQINNDPILWTMLNAVKEQ